MRYLLIFFALLFLSTVKLFGQSISLFKHDAEVWSTSQVINGKLNNFYFGSGNIYVNGTGFSFSINSSDSTFTIPIQIGEGISEIYADVNGVFSDTLSLSLAYKIIPEIYAYAEVNSSDVLLKAETIENPKSEALNYYWTADENNPAAVTIINPSDSVTTLQLNSSLPEGEYYFNVRIITQSGDTVTARTFLTLKDETIYPFNIRTDYAAWIDSAVIYEITPYIFVINGKFNHITAKLPDIVRLGVNTIWLQPVYSTYYRGQGYDIIDYFNVRNDLGTEADLRNLVQTAKSLGLKVIFDFVPNHSSIRHPYAQETIELGTDSHYWDFYQREPDNAPYSQHYSYHQGFINYFWDNLPNLNYNNPEVQKWITEAAKYWIKEYDIDGYRFDAVWGVTARNPQFTKQLRLALKRIKPEILMLAEDKASQDQVFDERFDVAYDWTAEESWVSHWSWQTIYNPNGNQTIFNHSNQNQRSALLRSALTNDGNGYADNAKILRFTDNNDHFYFITHHGVERTRMVGALLFTLDGVPLLYNGQEIGKSGHPYSTEFIFFPGFPIDYDDPNNLFPYYKHLINIRKSYPALYSRNFSEISVSPSNYVFGYRRWLGDQNLFTILNMASSDAQVNVTLPVNELGLDSSNTYFLTDLLSGEVVQGTLNELSQFSTSMERFSARIYSLADTIVIVGINDQPAASENPESFELHQNYPNPFNSSTLITFSAPSDGYAELVVYDLLGRKVAELLNEKISGGSHKVYFNASRLASGIYFYALRMNETIQTRKMILLR